MVGVLEIIEKARGNYSIVCLRQMVYTIAPSFEKTKIRLKISQILKRHLEE